MDKEKIVLIAALLVTAAVLTTTNLWTLQIMERQREYIHQLEQLLGGEKGSQ